MYFVRSPELVNEVLVNKNSSFIKSRILQRSKALLGEGLLTNEGAPHLRQRRLVQPAFHRDRLVRYGEQMAAIAEKTAGRFQDNEIVDIDREMMRLTLSIVGQTLFSANVEDDAATVGEAMTALIEMMPLLMLPGSQYFQYIPLPKFRRFQDAGALLDRTIYRIISERRASGVDNGDLLSMLLLARDEEDKTGMTDKQVRDEALTLFIAGHETTAVAATWAWHLLAQHPEVEARVHAEIDAAGGYAKLPYTTAVLSETMRLFPPAWAIGRMANEDVELAGYTVPKGSIVLISPYILHRDERWWPEPNEFRPERWDAALENTRPKHAYMPFGAGPRLCIGERFAWMEGSIILAALARQWRFESVPGEAVELAPLITLRPRGGLRLRAIRRR